jgi:hypothetical protein
VNIEGGTPDDGLLVDLLADIAPGSDQLHRLLVDNPAEFFDFPRAIVSPEVSTERPDSQRRTY